MTSCIPVFPADPLSSIGPKTFQHDALAADGATSDVGEGSDRVLNYMERLAGQYHKLVTLPFELAPPSRPSSPSLTSHSSKLHGRITCAMADANYSSSDPKWEHVTKLVRTAATSRRQGCAPGVRVGEKVAVDVGDYVFVMPDTEGEWEECERRWAARKLSTVAAVDRERKSKVKGRGKFRERETKSKYWSNGASKTATSKSSSFVQDGAIEPKENRITGSGHTNAIREQGPSKLPHISDVPVRMKSGTTTKRKQQLPLDFAVVKHAGASTATKSSLGSGAPARRSESLTDVQMISPERPRTPVHSTVFPLSMEDSSPVGIADISEASFFPPSFPSHLETSTPKDEIETNRPKKRKIPAIHPRPLLSSSPPSPPLSNWSPFDPAHPARKPPQPLGMSSSLPILSPTAHVRPGRESRPLKRMRPLTPLNDDVFISGMFKKPRTGSPQDVQHPDPGQTLPPSSPTPITTPSLSKSASPSLPTLPRIGTGLGNAKGLLVAATPERKELPNLTELLASSRKSKPRPRPPPKKIRLSPVNVPTDQVQADLCEKDTLPVLQEELTTPVVSPTKTYFSSPASGSSQSTPPFQRRPPRSPISPLFGPGSIGSIGRFSPPFTSTQHRHPSGGSPRQSIFKGGFGGAAALHSQYGQPTSIARGSSRFFGMYNSQFDVEAQVGQVSELLDRDIDFTEYLKDVDEIEKVNEQEQEQEKGEEIMV